MSPERSPFGHTRFNPSPAGPAMRTVATAWVRVRLCNERQRETAEEPCGPSAVPLGDVWTVSGLRSVPWPRPLRALEIDSPELQDPKVRRADRPDIACAMFEPITKSWPKPSFKSPASARRLRPRQLAPLRGREWRHREVRSLCHLRPRHLPVRSVCPLPRASSSHNVTEIFRF